MDFKSAITDLSERHIRIRGYDITDMIGNLTFAEGIYLILKGELPNNREKAMMEAILLSSVDHGLSPPSALAARTVFSGGNPLNAGVAAGVLTVGDSHGGAIEQCAKILQEAAEGMIDPQKTAKKVVGQFLKQKKRIPGYGHRIYLVQDPRTVRLFQVADQVGFRGKYIDLAVHIETELEKATGKKLPLNVDGAIAAIVSEMGFDWRLGKGFFIIARTPGLVAHVHEEWTREKPMRRLGPKEYVYDGPKARKLER